MLTAGGMYLRARVLLTLTYICHFRNVTQKPEPSKHKSASAWGRKRALPTPLRFQNCTSRAHLRTESNKRQQQNNNHHQYSNSAGQARQNSLQRRRLFSPNTREGTSRTPGPLQVVYATRQRIRTPTSCELPVSYALIACPSWSAAAAVVEP